MSNELYPESKQNKFPVLCNKPRNMKRYMCLNYWLTVTSGAVSTGQQNYFKKTFADDGRTLFAYHLHNLHHDCLRNLRVKKEAIHFGYWTILFYWF